MGKDKDMNAAEMAAYINGMLEGFSLDRSKPETRILYAVAEAIGKLADEVAVLSDESERVREYLDELDCDLGDLEAEYYGDDWDEWAADDGDDKFEPIIFEGPSSDGSDPKPDGNIEKGKDKGKN